MAHFLLPSTPIFGHVSPMLTIGRTLVERGHGVTVLTGRKYAPAAESLGLSFVPLPREVDYDDAVLGDWLPGRDSYSGLAAGRYDVIGLFIRAMPAQHRALSAALADQSYDAVLCETAFLGALPTLLATPADRRIPFVGVSATPLSYTSVDCAPFGSGLAPGTSAHTRRRNRLLNTVLARGPLRPIQRAIDAELEALGAPRSDAAYFDLVARFDTTFHLAVRGIEYPRRELPSTVHFVGPVRQDTSAPAELPRWWPDLDGGRPVVHVTQGTMDNVDLTKLLVPTLRALAAEDVLVVASTGGRPVADLLAELGEGLPENVRVAEFLPYEQLLPRTDLMVTNGGFGAVQRALSHGVPLVVAGSTEDKPEVAARVAWSGTGINLRTGRPAPAQIRAAVRTALDEPSYRTAAGRLRGEIAGAGDPLALITAALEALAGQRSDEQRLWRS